MRKGSRLDVGRVFATIFSPESVNRVLRVQIKGKIYSIRIVEDVFSFCAFRISPILQGHLSVLQSGLGKSDQGEPDNLNSNYE